MPGENMASERRKNPRLGLAIPVRVQGFLADGTSWEEISSTIDVSSNGACFPLSHEVELGQVLVLSLALPRRLRQFDLADADYRVYTLVRGVRRRADQPRVGVMFFGKYPPRGFQERPTARYLLPSDSIASVPVPRGLRPGDTPMAGNPAPAAADLAAGRPPATDSFDPASLIAQLGPDDSGQTPPAVLGPSTLKPRRAPVIAPPPRPAPAPPPPEFERPRTASTEAVRPAQAVPATEPVKAAQPAQKERRGVTRVELFVNFTIQLVDEWGAVLQEELTVADNIGRGGARVMTSMAFQVGDVILLQEAGGGFATRAEVRAITRVKASIDRLHLRFIDRHAPDRLMRQ